MIIFNVVKKTKEVDDIWAFAVTEFSDVGSIQTPDVADSPRRFHWNSRKFKCVGCLQPTEYLSNSTGGEIY